jgi:hypothetical protein
MERITADLRQWTTELIDAECRGAYREYEAALIEHYAAYFQRHQYLRCARHRYSARTLAAALPPGYADLANRMPVHSLHRFCRSGRSSQTLTLALFGAALQNDRSFHWLWTALSLSKRLAGLQTPLVKFEHLLAPSNLGEIPRTSQLDMTISTENASIVFEAKFSEAGLGKCSCAREGEGDPRPGFECAQRVYSRRRYWEVAEAMFGISGVRTAFEQCALSIAYQAIRSSAAAQYLAGDRVAAFILLFDNKNPYFRTTGKWPGWPALLTTLFARSKPAGFFFRAVSWQELVPQLPLDRTVREWAREKHRLG